MKLNNIIKNSLMLYIFNAERIIFPLILLPYLTKFLTTGSYAVYVYAYAMVSYLRLVVDFGFDFSATRDIAKEVEERMIRKIVTEVTASKVVLCVLGSIVIFFYAIIFQDKYIIENKLFFLLMCIEIFLEIFFLDFYFRGIEKMEIITIRYFIVKIIATVLILLSVKCDNDLWHIPLCNVLGNTIGAILVFLQINPFSEFSIVSISLNLIKQIRSSLKFFLTKITVSLFSFSNTIFLGRFASPYDVAIWSLAINIISAIQSLYSPISNALFPAMSKKFDISVIKKSLLLSFGFILTLNTFLWLSSEPIIIYFFGETYARVSSLVNILLFMLFFSVGISLFGWPVLGAVGGEKYMLYSTIIGASFHVIGIFLLYNFENFNAYTLSYLRVASEAVLFVLIIVFSRVYVKNLVKGEMK